MVRADVVIIGCGMQGATMALAAARSGLKPVLVERDRIASGATGNSYGFIHGGLRYLQTMHLGRWRRSRRAQAWFLKSYPDLVRPLRCIMPLYRGRIRSPNAFRILAAAESLLSGAAGDAPRLSPPVLLSADDVPSEYPIPRQDLAGAAVWHDLVVPDMKALLLAILSDAEVTGSALIEEAEVRDVMVVNDRVRGVRIVRPDRSFEEIATSQVIVCTGSWTLPNLAGGEPASTAVLAFNLLLDAPFPLDAALAVSEIPGRGRSYFLRPYEGGTLVGTFYRAAPGASHPEVEPSDVAAFRKSIERALPGSALASAPVRRVMAGLLPDRDGTGRSLSTEDVVSTSGPAGFCRMLGTKLTTAPLLSFETAAKLWPSRAQGTA
ncbi:FAD-dependent oxidoreductase [Sphingosinicella sp. CPCC 101087]|uniref:FAD-dependent oxidoreductase n=1 Tax=Sphingosinicella sp. CPCC 101087 TaxID=2497754 RepID=UPI00101CFFE7|nr:FAD-dependent oxidoreductase [Sphingosinicella sp. CPCC 101087]